MIKKKNSHKYRRSGKSELITEIGFLAPSLSGVLLFFVLPFFVVVYYSLIDNPINRNFVLFDNFKEVLTNDAFRMASRNTLLFSVSAVPLAVVISLAFAVILESKISFRSQLRASFLCPLMVPTASVVLVWQVMFHKQGTVNQLLEMMGGQPTDWLKTPSGMIVVVIMFLWKNIGYNMILFLAGLSNIPGDLMEVAELEGAGPVYRFFHLKLRYLSPTILFVTILSLINSFKIFREVYLLTGDYPDSLYMLQHFMNNTFSLLEYQKLSSSAIVMGLVMSVIIALLFVVEYWFGKDVE
ncbi:sugar ABC transporter permease [Ruminococcus sp. HUN007]|uniref:carbohydrate ABC transporter permease n=1 Tax=Ruminococcus sp. HUN007 TaxID=1514668 RepID=UPI001FA77ED7|nr:sugar ABC transporter permease [Ruminococcus sp. HUN007]